MESVRIVPVPPPPAAVAVPLTDTVCVAVPLVSVTVPVLLPSSALFDSRTFTVVADSVPLAVMLFSVPHELPLSVDTSNPDVTVTDTFAVKFAPLTVKLPVLLPADPTVPANSVSPVWFATVSDGDGDDDVIVPLKVNARSWWVPPD